MEISEVRKQVDRAMERARRQAAERRERVDQATRDYAVLLERTAVPLFRQVDNVLKVHRFGFNVFTPSGSVRLMSERNAEDFIELYLDATGDEPLVMGRTSRGRGHRVVASEQPVGSGRAATLTEEDVLDFLMKALEPFVEK